MSTTDQLTANGDQAASDAAAAEEKQTPARSPRRSRRKVTAETTAPAQAPAVEQPTVADDALATVPAGEADSSAEPAKATEEPTAPRRRAPRRKVTAETTSPAQDDGPAAGAPDSGTESVDTSGDDAGTDEPRVAGSVTDDAAGADGDAELDQDQADGEDDPDDEAQLPAASLLFQAPDPTRARRRRATRPTTTPDEAPAAQPSQELTSNDAEEAESSTGSSRGRRRRKAQAEGGEPRRGRKRAKSAGKAGDSIDDDATHSADVADRGEDAQETSDRDSSSTEQGEDSDDSAKDHRKRRRGGRGRRSRTRSDESAEDAAEDDSTDGDQDADSGSRTDQAAQDGEEPGSSSRRRRRRRPRGRSGESGSSGDSGRDARDEVTALKGSTRLEAKRQRRREGRAAGRRRPLVTEAEFLARRESVDRQMVVREQDGLNQIAVLEDGLLVEHYVARRTQVSMVGNVYIGRVQNVLPSMEAAFVDLGKGRNAVLYAGEVNWDAAGMEGKPRRIEEALKSGDTVLVQVTKDPIGHKGARLTSQVTLAGRFLVLVPGGSMTGISRKLPDIERARLKKILKKIVPDSAGVIVRTAAEDASEEQLAADVARLVTQWEQIEKKAASVRKGLGKAPVLLKGEPELAVRVVRDVFNEDFRKLIVSGPEAWETISSYVTELSPDLADRLEHWTSTEDVFAAHRIDEQLAKGFDRKVWLPSGGTLIIDRTEAMTVIDVNTGRFTGAGGTLEETVTRNNIEAAEEIVRQLRLRDIGGMVVIDFVDMVLESNRDLVLRRLVECLGRDRTRHQVTEVTSLGLVQMTRKRVGQGLVEAFSTPCECCNGRGFIVHDTPVENPQADMSASGGQGGSRRRGRKGKDDGAAVSSAGGRSSNAMSGSDQGRSSGEDEPDRAAVRSTLAQIAAAAEQAHKERTDGEAQAAHAQDGMDAVGQDQHAIDDAVATTGTQQENTDGATEPEKPARGRRRRRAVSTGVVTPDHVDE